MTDKDAAPVLQIKVGEHTYRLDFDELSGRDAQEFYGVTGVPLAAAMDGQIQDLHVIAGLVWLARRRYDRKLRYETVNLSLNYGMMRRGELDVSEPDDDDDGDPDPPA